MRDVHDSYARDNSDVIRAGRMEKPARRGAQKRAPFVVGASLLHQICSDGQNGAGRNEQKDEAEPIARMLQ
jgi:hypothetical protein